MFGSETLQHDLADHVPALEQRVGAPEVGGGDRAEGRGGRRRPRGRRGCAPRAAARGRGGGATRVTGAGGRASWTGRDPTPPAPPMISTLRPAWPPLFEIAIRSNSASHAVSVVRGSAA